MNRRRLPLLYPTKIFGVLLFVIATMWYASTSQNNAASSLLLYFTLGIFLVSIPQTLLNLTGLHVTVESLKPAFAGEEVAVPIEVVNTSSRTRYSCVVSLPGLDETGELIAGIGATKAARATLRFTAARRGRYEISQVDLRSSYPLGFLATRKRIATRQSYIVYPAAAGDPQLPSPRAKSTGSIFKGITEEGAEYSGVRAYVAGESQRHIDWKAVARGQPLMTKQFTAETDDVLSLDFEAVAAGNTESRLSQLALWVVEAERRGRRYALRLPAGHITASSGEVHYHRCLRALALF